MTTIANNSIKNHMSRTYADLVESFFKSDYGIGTDLKSFFPKADIAEGEKSYFIFLHIPGIKKEEVLIEQEGNKLIVSGEKKVEKPDLKFHSIESAYGQFKRAFTLPETIQKESIKAQYIDGILKIELPKAEKSLKSTIEIL